MSILSNLQNQTFLFTGTLAQFTRDEAEALVKANGGKVLSGVSAKLNYLVVGDDAGSKLEKAKKHAGPFYRSEICFGSFLFLLLFMFQLSLVCPSSTANHIFWKNSNFSFIY